MSTKNMPGRIKRNARTTLAVLALLLGCCLAQSTAFAGTTIYKLRGTGDTRITQANSTTGVETFVTNYAGGSAATLAQCPNGLIYYAINGGTNQLFSFNPQTPAIAPVSIGPVTDPALKMACSPGGVLYYLTEAAINNLHIINTATGAYTGAVVTITGTGTGGDISFNSAGTLFLFNNTNILSTVPLGGGPVTPVGTTGLVTLAGGGVINGAGIGLAFDASNTPFILTNGGPNFYSVNTAGTDPVATALSTLSGGAATGDLASINVPDPDLSITKTSNPTSVPSGQATAVTYTIIATNNSAYAVTGTITDNFPASVTAATWTCVASAGSTCAAASGAGNINTTATLAVGGTATYTVSATVTAVANVVNTANVALPFAFLTDATPANNTATNTILIKPTITKAFSPTTIGAGNTSNITFTLNNPSGIVLSNANFTDTLTNMSVSTTTIGGTCVGTTNSPALVVGATALNLTVPSLPVVGCTVIITVTSNTPGNNPNTSSGVSSTQTGSAGAVSNTATLTVLAPPTITKAFAPATIATGGTSVLTFTLTNPNTTAITGAAFTDTYPAGLVNTATPAGATTCTGGTVTAANNGNSVALATGTIPASSSCTVTVNVTSATAGSYLNSLPIGGLTTTNAGSNAAAATATLTVGVSISGRVYNDVNHNATLDGGEVGTGQTIFAKLILASNPTVAIQAVVVDTTVVGNASGSYSFSAVTPGTYTIILDNNNTLTDVTPSAPAGYVSTEAPNQTRSGVVVNNLSVPNQNFGLFNGSRLAGRVFNDNGVGAGGVANNGVQDGTEAGIPNVTVRATDNAGTTTFDTAATSGTGDYVLFIPAAAGANPIRIVETNLGGYVSTGGSVGTTAGTYVRLTDTTTFTNTVGTSYTGVNFADVPENSFAPDGLQAALPGTVVFYPHTFKAGTGGTVSFSSTNVATPANPDWTNTLYRDNNCNGQLDSATDLLISAAITVVANGQVCIIVKEAVPANAPTGAQDLISVTAQFTYTNASPALVSSYTRTDLTTVGTGTIAGLRLTKAVDRTTASPGQTLVYTITYTNQSTAPLSNVIINDATPPFTTFVSAAAGALPPNLTACSVMTPGGTAACNVATPSGGTGAIQWTFIGTLAPAASSSVSFTVMVQ